MNIKNFILNPCKYVLCTLELCLAESKSQKSSLLRTQNSKQSGKHYNKSNFMIFSNIVITP